MRYFDQNDDQLVLRESARDHLVRGAVWLFVAPVFVAVAVWLTYALFVETTSALALGVTAMVVAVGSALPAVVGLFVMGTANQRAERRAIHIDLGERTLTTFGGTPDVFRKPDAVVVARDGLRCWALRLQGESARTVVRRVPHGGGRDLGRAAEALADALGVEAVVPRAAKTAIGVIPDWETTWAALCYAPLDGVNVAYSLLALISSRDPELRFAAKQSLSLLVVELFLGFMVSGCVGIPIVIASAPFAVEALAFLCPLTILGLVRLGVRMYASVRAYRGELWVMPFLSPLVRRWAPSAKESGS